MEECSCPRVDEKKFQNKFFDWKGKVFYTEKYSAFFHIPLKIHKRISKLMMDVESSGYKIKGKEVVIQEDATFRGKIMIEIEDPRVKHHNILKFDNAKMYSTVFTEPWDKLARGVRSTAKELHKKKMKVEKVYFMYLTCPDCSKEKGYKTVIFFQVKEKKIKKQSPKALEKIKKKQAKINERKKRKEEKEIQKQLKKQEKMRKKKEKATKKAEKKNKKRGSKK